MKKIYTLSLLFVFLILKTNAQPPVAAPNAPARNAADVVSLFCGTYTDVAGTDWYPNWGQTTVSTEIMVATNPTRSYTTMNYQGVQFANPIDVSNMDSLHLDLWTPNCTAFDLFLINTTPGTVEQPITLTPTLSGWNKFNIALSQFNTIALHNVGQLKFVATPGGTSNVYIDNIYFYKQAKTPTITNFVIPSKTLGVAPFTIPAPTSNSTGAFTYTSSNTAVATVSGSMITVVGVGYTYITATQAAAGTKGVGKKSTTFNVTTGLPTTPTVAAPTPIRPSANVKSLFSNAYTNATTVDTWSASWDVADVADVTVAGDATKKYTNLNYAGVEFTTTPLDVTTMQYYHVDIWTPDATQFKIKLVDFGANGTFGGGDDVEFEYTCTPPAFSTWVSYDIPLSAFTTLTTKAHIAQMIFVASISTVYMDNVYFYKTTTAPVKLIDFKAGRSGNKTLLNWKTATENNNKGFSVERSGNGGEWNQLVFVNGNGTSVSQKEYTATDNSPLKGMNYYRLKQIDNDGKFTYSPIVSLRFSDNALGFSFYPNPVKGQLNISLETIESNAAVLKMMTADGKTVKTISINRSHSNSNLLFSTGTLSPGIYYLVLQDGGNAKSGRLVIE